ncbi:glucosamine-6-phosphate deaminase [Natronoflexus pectinivorans]|uniref:Glucosamine-6-phosphate deaminase n=1 Tax=Natronoflexus pectinivorans TaxID=682526 RepID=A0A4R2GK91_9BACT|nr:glucosamine-6-phosphate deaminase [Natronoflexus pectinivorans]TCO09261.1 glucosamine-6-phosphate deaminase [Natronoflexus pectinivorans]
MLEAFDKKISNPGKFKNEAAKNDPYFKALITKKEKIPTDVFDSSNQGSNLVAVEIADTIKHVNSKGRKCVLSLTVGSAPAEVYTELIRMHLQEDLSFKDVIVFGVMEFFPINANAIQSFSRNIHEKFIRHIDLPKEQLFLLNGEQSQESIHRHCQDIEEKIEKFGGIDYQLLGIGSTGHIGFNEPGSALNSLTRLVSLDDTTRTSLGSFFRGKENVPAKAITLGIKTILSAKKIRLLAWGEAKSSVIASAVENKLSEELPASFLQQHKDARIVLDMAAGAELTRIKTPWLIDAVEWNDRLIRKAVVWLCQKLGKPILKLTDRDYSDNGMGDLITEKGGSYSVNIKVFNDLQHTITGWPGGKPNSDDSKRPERKEPFPKRVLIFSPHPDDDVISMGGTMLRLVDHGHDVHVAYQVSGNIAVSDSDAFRYLEFVRDFQIQIGCSAESIAKIDHLKEKTDDFIMNKRNDSTDLQELRKIKSLIRVGEARDACRYANVKSENVHFLNLPFYETGEVEKNPIGKTDIKIISDLIRNIKPHQIYAAGDLSDPHGTHRVCLDAIFEAIDELKHESWMKDCWVWLYRGAWHEWDIHQVEMAVPISPDELMRKRTAIFKHQSQKDGAMFLGSDNREFWQRAEERNRGTAKIYDQLGMAEYEAIEAFVRYEFL